MKILRRIWKYIDSKRYQNQHLIFSHVGPIPFKERLGYLPFAVLELLLVSILLFGPILSGNRIDARSVDPHEAIFSVSMWPPHVQYTDIASLLLGLVILAVLFLLLVLLLSFLVGALRTLEAIFVPGRYAYLQRGCVVKNGYAIPYDFLFFVLFNL